MAPPDVYVLLCDTARADAFRPWGGPAPSPTVERLCAEGVAFRRAITAAPWTLPSTASIFTGMLPTEHRLTAEWIKPMAGSEETDLPADRPDHDSSVKPEGRVGPWLPDSLRDRGYRTWAASCNPWVSSWIGFDRGFDEFVDVRPRRRRARGPLASKARRLREVVTSLDHGGREALSSFGRWMRGATHQPQFAFVNLMELHDPYDPPPRLHPLLASGPGRLPGLRAPEVFSHQLRQRRLRDRATDDYIRTIRALYYASGRYQDDLLGEFVKAVEARGRPAIVIVVSDHGENLGEHGLFEHHSSLHETLLHVPLVAFGHRLDLQGAPVDAPVSLLALRPWLEAVADGSTEVMGWEGPIVSEYESTVERPQVVRRELHRWVAAGRDDRVPSLYYRPGMAVRDGRYKLVAVEGEEPSLYDLERDPGEENDIAATEPDRALVLRAHVDAWTARRQATGDVWEATSESEEIEEHLRMLGYLE